MSPHFPVEIAPLIMVPILTFFSYSRSCCESCSVANPISLCRGQRRGERAKLTDWITVGFVHSFYTCHSLFSPWRTKRNRWIRVQKKLPLKKHKVMGHINANSTGELLLVQKRSDFMLHKLFHMFSGEKLSIYCDCNIWACRSHNKS